MAVERCVPVTLWGRGWVGALDRCVLLPLRAGVGRVAIERCVPVTPLGQGLNGWQ